MSEEDAPSPSRHAKNFRPRGYLPLGNEDGASPMATHGHGTLVSLIRSISSQSLATMAHRRPSSVFRARDAAADEEAGERHSREFDDSDDFMSIDERRLSQILNGPQIRSQRLIGNSNPRYKWGKEPSRMLTLCMRVDGALCFLPRVWNLTWWQRNTGKQKTS